MEKHKVLEQRLRQQTGIDILYISHQHNEDKDRPFNYIEVYNIWADGKGDIANMALDIPAGEDCWTKLEKKILKLIAVLKE